MIAPVFPPLFSGRDAGGGDPFALACAAAQAGCDAGLVIHDLSTDTLRAAIVLAPEVPLDQAALMLPLCGVGFQNALGALAPPEVAVHLGWSGEIYLNGGQCGLLRMAASSIAPDHVPDWLVISLTLNLWPANEDTGLTPDQTSLHGEGCAGVDAVTLLESWVRHTLVGLNAWEDAGPAQLHREWVGLAHGLGDTVQAGGQSGTFIGLDENLGLLLKTGGKTVLIPQTANVTRPR